MKYSLLLISIALAIYSCRPKIEPLMNIGQSVDTVAIKEESLRIKSKIDTLIKQKKTSGGIACGTKFSLEIDRDSAERKIRSKLFYFPTNVISDTAISFSETAISSYFEEEKVVFVSIKHSIDLWESIKFEQNIYIEDSIQIKELLVGKFDELPVDVKEVINNSL